MFSSFFGLSLASCNSLSRLPFVQKTPYTESIAHLVDDVFPSTDWLASSLIDAELTSDLAASKAAIEHEIESSEAKIKELKDEVEEMWELETNQAYELTSVFMHRGEAGFGHCTCFQSPFFRFFSSAFL